MLNGKKDRQKINLKWKEGQTKNKCEMERSTEA